jgi:predicted nucleic acid-binding protein
MADEQMMLVDSDVLIAHLRGIPAAHRWLLEARREGAALSCSAITVVEITGGMRTDERREVWRLLGTMNISPVTELVARRAGELMRRYRRSHASIGIADYVIAATAEIAGLELATCNVRHFPMFKGLRAPFRLP